MSTSLSLKTYLLAEPEQFVVFLHKGRHQEPMAVGDIINSALLGTAIVGIFLTVYQVRKGNRVQKATFFKELYFTMFSDPEIRDAFYLLEHEKLLEVDLKSGFQESPHEKALDRLLFFVDLICALYAQNILTQQEMKFFHYEFKRIYSSSAIQDYLGFIRTVAEKAGSQTIPFSSFTSYCEKRL